MTLSQLSRAPARAIATAAVAIALTCAHGAAVAQNNIQLTTGYLTGVWNEDQQCLGGDSMVFTPNTMSSAGSVPVNYTITGPAQITIYGPGGQVPFNVKPINQNRMVVTIGNDASVVYRCGGGGGGRGWNNNNNNNYQVSPGYVIGGWGQNGNCSNPEVFIANGRMTTSNGDAASWQLFGNTLRLTAANGGVVDFSVQANGRQNMTLVQNNNGQVSNYTRCF